MFSLSGVMPSHGSSNNPINSLIDFTIVDDGTGIDISSLIILLIILWTKINKTLCIYKLLKKLKKKSKKGIFKIYKQLWQ